MKIPRASRTDRSPSLAAPGGAGPAARAPTQRTELSIRDLVSYRVSRAASLMSRGAALRYRREFDVSLGEWRALALLATGAPPSLMQLARSAGLDKAQMSRVVSSLVERGLVVREGARGTACLLLTEAGRAAHAGLIAAAGERDRAFRSVLSAEELAVLERVLGKLVGQARLFIEEESRPADREAAG